jgi:exonuclease VII small subunit
MMIGLCGFSWHFASVVAADLSESALAQVPTEKSRSESIPSAASGTTMTVAAAEALAIPLVDEHLPMLRRVLDRLRTDSPNQYEKAVRDLARSVKRLESARGRDEQLYELELDLLKARTTTSLVVARLKVRDSEADRRELQSTVTKMLSAELRRAEFEVETLNKRLERMNKQADDARNGLQRATDRMDDPANAVYEEYLRKAGRLSPATRKQRTGETVSP